jgi:hypothetical protein
MLSATILAMADASWQRNNAPEGLALHPRLLHLLQEPDCWDMHQPLWLFKTPVFQSNLRALVQNTFDMMDCHALEIDLPLSDSKIGQELMAQELIWCWHWIYKNCVFLRTGVLFEAGWFDGSILSALVKKFTRATPSCGGLIFFDPPHFYCTYLLFWRVGLILPCQFAFNSNPL